MPKFEPPHCPYVSCRNHEHAAGRFYLRSGSYRPACRRFAIPRFRCKSCRRSFSRQTFRVDYRDRRPDLNVRVFEMLVSGVGLRQIARTLGIDVHSVQGKLRKLGKHAKLLHDNACRRLPAERTYVMDEEETYEGASIRPLTVPILIDSETWFIVATEVGSIRRLAPVGTVRRRRQELEELRRGRRTDESRVKVMQTLLALRQRVPKGRLVLRSDEKASYASLVRQLFGERAVHETTSGKAPRTTGNPLFPINITIAMSRDNCGRLRRRSWLVSKKAEELRSQLALFVLYRNYVRKRFGRDDERDSPARLLDLMPRALSSREAIRWRQDQGARSILPTSGAGCRTFLVRLSSVA